MRAWWMVGLGMAIVLVVGLISASVGNEVVLEVWATLLAGWIGFLQRVGPKMRPTLGGLVTFLGCLVVLGPGLHLFLGWLYRSIGRADTGARRRWRVRWTAALLALVVLMFVAGISAVGVVHQAGWIARDRGHLTRLRPDESKAIFHLEEIAGGVLYGGVLAEPPVSERQLFPVARFDNRGTPLHGWMTLILPFIGVASGHIDRDVAWNDPRNAPNFKTFIPPYLNPAVTVVRDGEGYGLSHYAGNVHVFQRTPRPLAGLAGGASNTLLIGEVAGHFQAWGRSLTERDPTAGLNTTLDGFASPTGDAVLFLFADGSARFVRADVDPTVLRRMAGAAH